MKPYHYQPPTGTDTDADIFERFNSEAGLYLDERPDYLAEVDEAYEAYKESKLLKEEMNNENN